MQISPSKITADTFCYKRYQQRMNKFCLPVTVVSQLGTSSSGKVMDESSETVASPASYHHTACGPLKTLEAQSRRVPPPDLGISTRHASFCW
jgi:hypothetical protein